MKNYQIIEKMLNNVINTNLVWKVIKNDSRIGGYCVICNDRQIIAIATIRELKIFLIAIKANWCLWSETQTIYEYEKLGGKW